VKKFLLILTIALVLLLCACGHTHEYAQEVVAPTCTQDGYTTYTCECGDTYNDNTVKAAHTKETLPAQAASCTKEGLTEGAKCSVCGEILTAQQPTPVAAHTYGEWTVAKDATYTETGIREKVCTVCGDQATEDIPLKENPGPYNVTLILNGGGFGGYTTIEALGDDFLADFNRYGDGSVVTRENFQPDSHPCVKTSLANAQMLEKWNWLWCYMLDHLQTLNADQTSAYITDTYPILEKMINGDTGAINESANARTSIRSYIHGFLNSMKGCGDINPDFAKFSPDFSSVKEQQALLEHQYDLELTLGKGEALPVPTKAGSQFAGWADEQGNIVTELTNDITLYATWK
jgi:uncharacterized repeat protein (TIGR02543 family)